MRRVIVFGLVLISCGGCAARLGKWHNAATNDRLAVEWRRLEANKDPVRRTLTYIKIAQLLIGAIGRAASRDDLEQMRILLHEYAIVVQSAQDTMVNSGRDPAQQPEGFTDLEVVLREHTRYLEDIRRSLSMAEREPIDSTVATAVSVRKELLVLIFSQPEPSPHF